MDRLASVMPPLGCQDSIHPPLHRPLGLGHASLEMHPNSKSSIQDAQLNAIEVFKIINTTGRLAAPNLNPLPQTPNKQISKKKNSSTKRPLTAEVVSAVFGVVFLSLITVLFLIKHKKNVYVNKAPNKKYGTSLGSGSSSLPTHLYRHFSIAKIRATTNNFNKLLVVGVGGFAVQKPQGESFGEGRSIGDETFPMRRQRHLQQILAALSLQFQPNSKFITDAINCEFDDKDAEFKKNAGADIKECMINEEEYTATSLSEPEIAIPVSHTQQMLVEGEILLKQIATRKIMMKQFFLKFSLLDPEAKNISLLVQV
ncbi:hypothetical protein LR48_Vigan03g058700 [Vigna angularis]|uniref:Uncharacterized protein n=1 Tax=Phaseolus angularis TaxID=3914 RepID=A0A0L9U357_PHAAN|nr:hypothetical protein LR48_Vigan03g058700 [Vigna angularis]